MAADIGPEATKATAGLLTVRLTPASRMVTEAPFTSSRGAFSPVPATPVARCKETGVNIGPMVRVDEVVRVVPRSAVVEVGVMTWLSGLAGFDCVRGYS